MLPDPGGSLGQLTTEGGAWGRKKRGRRGEEGYWENNTPPSFFFVNLLFRNHIPRPSLLLGLRRRRRPARTAATTSSEAATEGSLTLKRIKKTGYTDGDRPHPPSTSQELYLKKYRGDWSPKKERLPPTGKNYRVWEGKEPPPRRRKRPESSSSSASSSSEEDDKNERTRARSGWASLPEMGKKYMFVLRSGPKRYFSVQKGERHQRMQEMSIQSSRRGKMTEL